MTLQEFLTQTNYTQTHEGVTTVYDFTAVDVGGNYVVSDADALLVATRHTEMQGQFFNNNTMNSVLTQVRLLAPFEAILQDFTHPWFNEVKAVMNSQEYNFRQDSPVGQLQIQMMDTMISGVDPQGNVVPPVEVTIGGVTYNLTAQLTQLRAMCIHIANKQVKPLVNTTLLDVKKVRHPIGWQAVTIASGNDKVVMPEGDSLISASNAGAFRFTVNPTENFNGQIQIRIKAKKAEDTNFGLFSQFTITFNDSFVTGQPVFQVFKRYNSLAGFRHFIFEYQAPYAGAVSSVVVENV